MRFSGNQFDPSIPTGPVAGDHSTVSDHRSPDIGLVAPRVPTHDRSAITTDRPLVVQVDTSMGGKRLGSPPCPLPRIVQDPPGRQGTLVVKLQQQVPVQDRVVVSQDHETEHGHHAVGRAADGTPFAHLLP